MDIQEAKKILSDNIAFSVIADFADKIINELALKRDAKILDVGTGAGNMAIALAINGHAVITGEPEDDDSDYSKQDWLTNAQKVSVDHLITFKPFSAENMPFENESFDAVFLFGCFHHIHEDKRHAALKECVRVSNSNGMLCIFEPNQTGIELIRQIDPDHPDAADIPHYMQGMNLSMENKKGEMFDAFILKKITL